MFDDSVLTGVIRPTVADLQEEVRQAGTDRRRRLLAQWRGYAAFWTLVLASPVVFRSWPMTPQADSRALLNVSALIAAVLVVVTVLATSGAMVEFGSTFEWLPESLLASLGDAHVLAFMAGPVALVLLVAINRWRGVARATVRPAEATLVILLSTTLVVATGTAVFVAAFTAIARTGGGGIALVHDASVSALQALVYASIAVSGSSVIAAALLRGARHKRSTGPACPIRF